MVDERGEEGLGVGWYVVIGIRDGYSCQTVGALFAQGGESGGLFVVLREVSPLSLVHQAVVLAVSAAAGGQLGVVGCAGEGRGDDGQAGGEQ
jgi:hypothetical protein